MPRIHGTAGKSSRTMADKRRWARKAMALIVCIVVLVMMWIFVKTNVTLTGTASIIAFVFYIATLKWIDRNATESDRLLRKRTRDAERGAKGEDAVAALLATLPDNYIVFHDLAQLRGDIDHIVVGPTGMFVIETKAHGGKVHAKDDQVFVNGRPPEKDFIAQIWRNAYWVRDVLKNTAEIDIPMKPILVFSNAFVTARSPVKGVRVINKKLLVDTILRDRPTEFPVERVVAILKQKSGCG